MNLSFVASKLRELIGRLSFTDEELSLLDARTSTEIALLDSRRINHLEDQDRRKRKIREDLLYLNSHRLELLKAGAFTPEALVAQEAKLNADLSSLQEMESDSDIAMRETMRDVVKLSELLKDVTGLYESAIPEEKEQIVRLIFSELSLSGNTFSYQCATGFRPLAHRFDVLDDPKAWLSELWSHQNDIRNAVKAIEKIVSDGGPQPKTGRQN